MQTVTKPLVSHLLASQTAMVRAISHLLSNILKRKCKAFFLLFMALMCFMYMIAAIRTNVVFFLIFATLVFTLSLLAGAFWQFGAGNASLGSDLQIVRPSFLFNRYIWVMIVQLLIILKHRRVEHLHLLPLYWDGTYSSHNFLPLWTSPSLCLWAIYPQWSRVHHRGSSRKILKLGIRRNRAILILPWKIRWLVQSWGFLQ